LAAVFLALPMLIHSRACAEEASDSKSTALLHATSPYEDMVKCALGRNDAGLAKYIAKAELNVGAVKGAMKADAAKKFESELGLLKKAAGDKAYLAVAAK